MSIRARPPACTCFLPYQRPRSADLLVLHPSPSVLTMKGIGASTDRRLARRPGVAVGRAGWQCGDGNFVGLSLRRRHRRRRSPSQMKMDGSSLLPIFPRRRPRLRPMMLSFDILCSPSPPPLSLYLGVIDLCLKRASNPDLLLEFLNVRIFPLAKLYQVQVSCPRR